jgi:DNA-binding response OmpR family regulator
MKKGTIMIIEDDENIRTAVEDHLFRQGYAVLTAETGSEAIRLAKDFDGDIDLAMLDINLPDMGGQQVFSFLMAERPQIKVLMCSGHPRDRAATGDMIAGEQAYIEKPFKLRVLSEKLTTMLSCQ